MIGLLNFFQNLLDRFRVVDFLAPLAIRLYMVPIFWMAGTKKLGAMEDTIAWFGNPDYPAWYYNLKANPEVTVSQDGKSRKFIARLVEGQERQECWQLAVHYYPGYQLYAQRTEGRKIPIIVLEPVS